LLIHALVFIDDCDMIVQYLGENSKYMKVILLQNVSGLGKADEVKEAADGYARNFLFPKHLAVLASAKSVADLNAHKEKVVKDNMRDLEREQTLAEKLEGLALSFKEKASASGQLFAAVGAVRVAQALVKLGHDIDKDQIQIGKPIKEAGEYEAVVKLRHGLEAKLSISVSV